MRRAPAIVFGLLLACPLFVLPGTGFDAARLPAALGLVTVLLGLLFARAARAGDRPPGPAPLRTAAFLLLGIHLLSLIVARSLAEASVPILVLLAGVSVFACVRGGVVPRDSAPSLVSALAALGLVFAAIGIVQKLSGVEPVSTEGNRNYSGALAAMLLPVALAASRSGPSWSRLLSGFSAANLAVLLLLTESRGALLAGVAGLFVAGAAMQAKRVIRGGPAAGLALIVLAGGFLLFQGRQLSPERMETAGFRLNVWKSGGAMLAQRPLLGWGAGNFAGEYPPFRSEEEFRFSHKYVVDAFKEVEDAHSSWFQIAVETGVPGLLAFLLVIYIAARLWRYDLKVASDPDRAALLAGLGGGAAAYLVAGLFNTLTLKTSHTVLFWSFLALIELIGESRPWRQAARAREWKVALPAAAAFATFFATLLAYGLGSADAAFTEGMRTNNPQLREARLRESIDANPESWRAHYELALTLSAVGRFPGAVEEGRATLRLRPHHLDALNHTAISLIRSGGDEKEVEALFRRAIAIAPYYYKSLHNFAQFERNRGNRAEARGLFTRALEHKADYVSSYFWRGMLAWSGGDAAMALDDFRKARELGFDVAGALRAERLSAENDPRLAEFFR